jgi:hypothetical protein
VNRAGDLPGGAKLLHSFLKVPDSPQRAQISEKLLQAVFAHCCLSADAFRPAAERTEGCRHILVVAEE